MKYLIKNATIMLLVLVSASLSYAAENEKKDKKKAPSNAGILTVKTEGGSYPVFVDGQEVGKSGAADYAEFYLVPGMHVVEVFGPGGARFSKEVNIAKKKKECICVNFVEREVAKACPYDVSLASTGTAIEGDLLTFTANDAKSEGIPLTYKWRISPGAVPITSGIGSKVITIDTNNLGGQTVLANLVVSDGRYDSQCSQDISAKAVIQRPEKPSPFPIDVFPTVANDDDKARLDAAAIEIQNNPSDSIYIILYAGRDEISKVRTPQRIAKLAFDYLVGKGIEQSRITIVEGGIRERATYEIYRVPAGARTPMPS